MNPTHASTQDLTRRPGRLGTPRLIAVAILTSALLWVGLPVQAAVPSDTVGLINDSRAEQGLRAMSRHSALDAVAQAWSEQMAAEGDLHHNPDYADQIPPGWRGAAENVAYNSTRTGAAFHEGFMGSDGHRANILGDFTHVGIGYVEVDGVGWMTQLFANYPTAPSEPSTGGEPTSSASPRPSSTESSRPPSASTSPSPSPSTSGTAAGWLARGSTGPEVQELQEGLATLGYAVTPDGDFGAETHSAVERFQRDAGLAPDGVVGPATQGALTAALDDLAPAERPADPAPEGVSEVTEATTRTSEATAEEPEPSTDEALLNQSRPSGLAGLDAVLPTGGLVGILAGSVCAFAGLLLIRRRILYREPG